MGIRKTREDAVRKRPFARTIAVAMMIALTAGAWAFSQDISKAALTGDSDAMWSEGRDLARGGGLARQAQLRRRLGEKEAGAEAHREDGWGDPLAAESDSSRKAKNAWRPDDVTYAMARTASAPETRVSSAAVETTSRQSTPLVLRRRGGRLLRRQHV